MSDLDRLNNAKVTEEYDNYSEMTVDELLKLEDEMSSTYYKFIENDNYIFSLNDYAEIIRELTLREENK
tara:strand:+ start:417 stop:623 length:207 start_codon:yes stop_codon:yes gene_type:complete